MNKHTFGSSNIHKKHRHYLLCNPSINELQLCLVYTVNLCVVAEPLCRGSYMYIVFGFEILEISIITLITFATIIIVSVLYCSYSLVRLHHQRRNQSTSKPTGQSCFKFIGEPTEYSKWLSKGQKLDCRKVTKQQVA